MSLRLQDEGQKKAHGLHTESLTRIFLTFPFDANRFQTDLQALPLAAAENETVQYFTLDKASAAHLQDSLDSCDSCSKKIYSRMNYIMLTTNLPNQTNHLICRLNQKKNPSIIPFVLSRHNQNETKIKKKKIKKRIREKTQ